jgi:hypothetical protein
MSPHQVSRNITKGKIDLIYTKSISRFRCNCVDFLETRRRLKELEVHRSRNRHTAIIDEYRFKQAQKLKAKRSNIEIDAHGNKVSRSAQYSTKKPMRVV